MIVLNVTKSINLQIVELKFFNTHWRNNYMTYDTDVRLWYKTTVSTEQEDENGIYYSAEQFLNTVQFPIHLLKEKEAEILDMNDEELFVELLYLTDTNSLIIKDYQRGY